MEKFETRADGVYKLIFRPYITVKGKKVYPKKSRVFPLWVKVEDINNK